MSKRSIAQHEVNAIEFSHGLDQSLMGGQVGGVTVENPRHADGVGSQVFFPARDRQTYYSLVTASRPWRCR